MSLLWIIIGSLICYGSTKCHLGTPKSPGPGFFPFLSGIVMIGSAIPILLKTISDKIRNRKSTDLSAMFPSLKRLFGVLLMLIGYLVLLNSLGFILCTFLFMGFCLKITGSQKWVTVILGAVLTSLGAYIVFQWVLESQLPKGIFGF
jgi:putative tricarboxylic transport membrane protein